MLLFFLIASLNFFSHVHYKVGVLYLEIKVHINGGGINLYSLTATRLSQAFRVRKYDFPLGAWLSFYK